MTPPVELVLRSVEVSVVMARLEVVALPLVSAVVLKMDDVAFVVLRFVANRLVEVAFVAVALVNTPVDGVAAPIGVFSIVPPLIVSASGICASVARP